jgi:hypothetical protein
MRQPSGQSAAEQEMPHNSAIPYAVDHFTMPCAWIPCPVFFSPSDSPCACQIITACFRILPFATELWQDVAKAAHLCSTTVFARIQ